MLNYIFDATIITLLAVTIAYAVRLNGKLNLIKNQKQDFANNIKAFSDATESAIIAVEELHIKGEAICKLIDEKIRRAQLMGDEIDFITNRGGKQLMALKALDSKQNETQPRPALNGQVNSIAEAQLLKALRDREFKEALN